MFVGKICIAARGLPHSSFKFPAVPLPIQTFVESTKSKFEIKGYESNLKVGWICKMSYKEG